MATSRGSLMEIEGRFFGCDGRYISFLMMPGAKRVTIPVLDEASESWKTAAIGQDITLRVSTDFCVRSGMFDGVAGSRSTGGGPGVISG